jgi:hypothetical protein
VRRLALPYRPVSLDIPPVLGPVSGTTLAYDPLVTVQRSAAKALVAVFVLSTAIVAVGLTAPADGVFSIAVHPVFLRLGINLDVKLGSLHLHASWSALDRSVL